MPFITRKAIFTGVIVTITAFAALAGFIWSGIYNIGADDTHSKPMYTLMQTMRERSIAARANKLHPPPNLNDPALIRQGAGNYSAMCTGCHLAPGMAETELSKGLYPAPPNLTRKTVDAATAFWVIKHGIKASGMPAWGKSMSDEYIWNLVAFVQQLPKLNAEQYQAMVDSSGGHAHGGGEAMPHDDGGMPMQGMAMDAAAAHAHPPGSPAAHDDVADPSATRVEHRHADGTVESHPAPVEHDHDPDHDH